MAAKEVRNAQEAHAEMRAMGINQTDIDRLGQCAPAANANFWQFVWGLVQKYGKDIVTDLINVLLNGGITPGPTPAPAPAPAGPTPAAKV